MKKLYALAIIPVAIVGLLLWPSPKHPTLYQPTNVAPDTKPTPTLVAPADSSQTDPTPTAPADTAPVQPVNTTILEADSTSYPAGKVNTPPITSGDRWGVDITYSGSNDVSFRVISAVSGIPLNFLVSHNAPNSSQFSFTEQPFDYAVYLEITAPVWHVKVVNLSQGAQLSYHLVVPQNWGDWQCEALFPHCPYTPDPQL